MFIIKSITIILFALSFSSCYTTSNYKNSTIESHGLREYIKEDFITNASFEGTGYYITTEVKRVNSLINMDIILNNIPQEPTKDNYNVFGGKEPYYYFLSNPDDTIKYIVSIINKEEIIIAGLILIEPSKLKRIEIPAGILEILFNKSAINSKKKKERIDYDLYGFVEDSVVIISTLNL